jgi:Fe2+ or Zn2+ uptake regulation protein
VAVRDVSALRRKAESYLRGHGLRLTKLRGVIIDEFLRCEGFVAADDFIVRVRERGSESTSQRMLRLLVESGVARRHLSERQFLYEVVGEGPSESVLVCMRCRSVTTFRDARLDTLTGEVAATHGFLPESRRMEMHGVCSDCASER